MVCPDCGGVVGATETTEAGPPCKCFVADTSTGAAGKSDTVADVPSPAEVPPAKVCRICGKDVTGQKRVRDTLGYFCYECAVEQEKKETQGRVRCKVCGKLTNPENISNLDGTKMCHRCVRERDELKKQQIKRMGFKGARTREELRRIYGMVAMIVVLLIIIIYGIVHSLHGH